MKKLYLIVLVFTVLTQSCKKSEDAKPIIIEAPKSVTILSGDNQTGYPNQVLPDSIVIEVLANKPEELLNYSYAFYTRYYGNWIPSKSHIVNNRLFISAIWPLNSQTTSQELKFYLTEKCEQPGYPTNCKKLDSLIIRASIKNPWEQVYAGDGWDLYDIHFSDDNNGIAVGDLPFSTGYLKTTNGGNSWSVTPNSRNDLYQLSFSDRDTGIVIVTNNWALFTNDGGQSFHEGIWTPPFIGHLSSSDYFMQSSKTIFTVGNKGGIAKSIDGGKSWKTYEGFNFINRLYSITCPGKNVCYACGDVAKVVKSENGGESWFQQEVMLNNYLQKIYFLDNNFGFAAGENGALIRTTDGGTHWGIINTALRFTIIDIFFYTRDLGYIVSTSGEIGKTEDGGLTWSLLNKDNYGVYDLSKVYFKGQTILGLQGGSIFKYNLSK